jgi:hypothetical protein
MELRDTASGVEVEKVLVFETVGSVENFKQAATDVGLYWLGERDRDDIKADDEFYDPRHRGSDLDGRIYMVFANRKALRNLRSLYDQYKKRPNDPRDEHVKWYELFNHLRDVRSWGPEDRLKDTGLAEVWQARATSGYERLRIEVEIWYRRDERAQKIAEAEVAEAVAELGGRVTTSARVSEIAYHAVVAELPIGSVGALIQHKRVRLIQADSVMFLRPLGQVATPIADEDELSVKSVQEKNLSTALLDVEPMFQNLPTVGLLDGLPLTNHHKLAGFITVDDPDDWAANYLASDRRHGTAMASLILHGELDAPGPRLRRPLYVRPILAPDPNARRRDETIPEDVLAVDLLHRAVRRMFEREGEEPPAASSVRIINLSVGDPARPYYMFPSPWARMVDYLSHKYRVLFVVSAGNQLGDIDLNLSREAFAELRLDPARLEAETLKAIRKQLQVRRILSPAEAINAVTVGATHDDASTWRPDGVAFEPISTRGLPSPVTPHGSGFKLAIKPEVLFPGGRQLYRLEPTGSGSILTLNGYSARPPGHRVAAPGDPGDLDHERYCRGTSNAAALATRSAAQIYEMLQDLQRDLGPNAERIDDAHMAVLLKALLVHGARWGNACETLRGYFPAERRDHERHEIAGWLGYGEVDPARVLACTGQRTTLIACNHLLNDFAHVYRLPLPPSLNGRKIWRRLTVTLAWFTSINPFHEDYQRGDLWFSLYDVPESTRSDDKKGEAARLLKIQRTGANWQSVRRGTVQHEILEGESASVFDEEELRIAINCRDVAGRPEFMPYGLAVTLEVAETENVPIYDEIRARLQVQVRSAGPEYGP